VLDRAIVNQHWGDGSMDQFYWAEVDEEGELVIPAEFRKQLGVVGEQEVVLQMDESGLWLRLRGSKRQ
jgi:DNA-binding transcriptional regulator/RsmH inhibitor MraZ